jgi:hypothetical protein
MAPREGAKGAEPALFHVDAGAKFEGGAIAPIPTSGGRAATEAESGRVAQASELAVEAKPVAREPVEAGCLRSGDTDPLGEPTVRGSDHLAVPGGERERGGTASEGTADCAASEGNDSLSEISGGACTQITP